MKRVKQKMSYREITESVLETIADNLIKTGGIKPRLPVILGLLIKLILEKKRQKIKESQIKRVLKNLEKKEIIFMKEKNDNVYVTLSESGEIMVKKYSIKALLALKLKRKKWTGKWFLVFFDVPELQRSKRDYLRRFLLKIGFYPYQKSVYIFPYECEQEINLIKKIVEGARYMRYIVAEKIEDEEIIKNYFHL